MERQNVNLCARLYDDKNVAALKQYQLEQRACNVEGTICFLEIKIQWWKTMNVNHALKGNRFKDSYRRRLTSVDHNNLF
jgi:hypothetical protein